MYKTSTSQRYKKLKEWLVDDILPYTCIFLTFTRLCDKMCCSMAIKIIFFRRKMAVFFFYVENIHGMVIISTQNICLKYKKYNVYAYKPHITLTCWCSTQLYIVKSGVGRSMDYFSYLCLKHRFGLLIRTTLVSNRLTKAVLKSP